MADIIANVIPYIKENARVSPGADRLAGGGYPAAGGGLVFTPDRGAAAVSGAACAAQGPGQTLHPTPGRLPWDRAGSSLPLTLNDVGSSSATVIDELEQAAIAGPRVGPGSVKVARNPDRTCRLSFTPLGAVRPEALDYDLAAGGA
jgi:hypothetical protein